MTLVQGDATLVSYHLGRFIAIFLFIGLILYLVSRKWQKVRQSVLPVTIIAASVATLAAASGGDTNKVSDSRQFLPENRVVEWMSRSRSICLNRDVQSNTCEAAGLVQTATEKQVDVLLVMIAAADASSTIKIAMPVRSDVTSRGLCTTFEKPEDLAIQFYGSKDSLGVIGASDQLIPLAPDMEAQAAQMARMGGLKAGDVLCDRYVAEDTKDGQVTALRVVSYVNGSETKGAPPMIYHFFDTDAHLPLRNAAAN
jgi:hypothetical protein